MMEEPGALRCEHNKKWNSKLTMAFKNKIHNKNLAIFGHALDARSIW